MKTHLTFILTCLLLGVVPAMAQVQNLTCEPHEADTPSADSLIRFVWEAPDGMPDATDYGLFDTDEAFTFDAVNTGDLSVFSGTGPVRPLARRGVPLVPCGSCG